MKTVCFEKQLSRNYVVEVVYFVTHQSHGMKFLHHFVVVVIAQVTPLGDKIEKVAA